ncbi:MAG: type II/IV secretion system protein, partial [Planctomycetaceae bacterium]|nr:type II/IV secretion system protein [Planctomycetaceae bacterium]
LPLDFPLQELNEKHGGELYKAVGCRECRQVGYRGRSGIYELLVTSNRIRSITGSNTTSWEIKKTGLAEGMKTLRMDAWRKAMIGQTSADEVVRITKADEL